jgi:hypothetical protein
MLSVQRLPVYAVGVFMLGACQKASEPAPATAAATASDPAAVPPELPSAEVAASAGAASTSPAGSASPYPMCGGENQSNAASSARTGPVSIQLAPAFLDQMVACKAEDGLPHEGLPTGEGTINAKGDCEFSNGVSCHYHSGSEFVSSNTSKQTPGQGELHCIVPSQEAKSPHVYGGHIVCRQPHQGEVHGGQAAHDVHQGASCSAAIVSQIAPCQSFSCCDDGTLTGVITDLTRDGRNDIRPDFRICSDTLEVDCDLLANYTPHTANSPALGGVGDPVFVVAALHEPAKSAKEHAAH